MQLFAAATPMFYGSNALPLWLRINSNLDHHLALRPNIRHYSLDARSPDAENANKNLSSDAPSR